MADDTLAATYSDARRNLKLTRGRFSPNGEILAFTISSVKLGDPDQVWCYNLHSRRLLSVTDELNKLGGSVTIENYACGAGGVLYAAVQQMPTLLLGGPVSQHPRHFFVAMTEAAVKEIDRPPAGIAKVFERPAAPQSAHLGPYSVAVEQRRHRLQVLYPDIQEHSIVTYDLRTHQSRRLVLPNGNELELLDRTRDRSLTAYTVYGPCQYGDKNTPARAWRQKNVCFVEPL